MGLESGALHQVVGIPIVVDKTTGETTIEQRLSALEVRAAAVRKETLDDLSRGIGELGDYIKRIATP